MTRSPYPHSITPFVYHHQQCAGLGDELRTEVYATIEQFAQQVGSPSNAGKLDRLKPINKC